MAETPTPSPAETPPARRSPVPLIALCVVLGAGALFGVRQYLWGRTHIQTDDAYLTGSLVNVSPAIGGTLAELRVREGDPVHAGQLLARLNDDTQQAAVRQAEAALAAARSRVPLAAADLAFQERSTDAAILKAQAGEAIQRERADAARAQVELTRRTTGSQLAQALRSGDAARAQAAQADAQVAAAAAQVAQIEAQIGAYQAAQTGAQRAVAAAHKGVDVVRARIPGAEADAEKTRRDDTRFAALLERDAVTRQQAESVHAQAEAARAALAALREQASQAEALAYQAEAAQAQAEAQVRAVEAQTRQARAALDAARKAAQAVRAQAAVAEAAVDAARAGRFEVAVQERNRRATDAQTPQANAEIRAAQAGRSQSDARREAVRAARIQVREAEATLSAARKILADTRLTAPRDGVVLKKGASVGAALAPGQTLLTLTQGRALWLTANYKETQVRDLRVGQPVEIVVDALPGQVFHGRVAVIGAATGATVSLLPPDNATGNFTKVVQRIPVKIALEGDTTALRQGMSCTATIDTADRSAHPERVPAGWDGRDTDTLEKR